MTVWCVGRAQVQGWTVLEIRRGSATYQAGRSPGLSKAWFPYLQNGNPGNNT